MLSTDVDSTAFGVHFPARSASQPRVSDTTTGNSQSGEAGVVSCAYQVCFHISGWFKLSWPIWW